MSRLLKIILIATICLFSINVDVNARDIKPGYSDWSEYPTNSPYEESTIQYGRKLPIEWSAWSTDNPSSFTRDYRIKDGDVKHYAYNNAQNTWYDVGAKSLYTWDFGYKALVTYAYIDVDTYKAPGVNYQAPPMQLYCDGKEIASIGVHHELDNWSPRVNHSCRYMELKMSDSSGNGRNRTAIVGTWVTTSSTWYSYVTKWGEPVDWRFDKSYDRIYGENPQIPVQRTVYSHPLTYHINYALDGGSFVGNPTYTYTVNDEVYIPSATKVGYDFLGFVDSSGKVVTKIERGTYGNITLRATYKRRPPTLYISYTYFDKEDKKIEIDELIKRVNGTAKDELDGDISKDIKVSKIVYNSNLTVNNPDCLDISNAGYVDVTFYVINSGDMRVEVTRRFYILDKGEEIEDYDSGIKIFSRYISEEFKDSLDSKSIWRISDYADVLSNAYRRCKD